jgi:hypothetical protein
LSSVYRAGFGGFHGPIEAVWFEKPLVSFSN